MGLADGLLGVWILVRKLVAITVKSEECRNLSIGVGLGPPIGIQRVQAETHPGERRPDTPGQRRSKGEYGNLSQLGLETRFASIAVLSSFNVSAYRNCPIFEVGDARQSLWILV